LSLDP